MEFSLARALRNSFLTYELLGTYLENLPIDQFNGQSLQYRVLDQGFILYSVGQDGIDQLGQRKMTTWIKPHSHREGAPRPETTSEFNIVASREYDGYDWVLWPRH